jgi:peroxiredoxin
MELQRDGTFRVEDVSAGVYELSVVICRWASANMSNAQYEQLASGDAQFDVPSMPGGRSDVPLQVAPITMHLNNIAAIGKPAPDFTVPTLDGKTLTLSDFRGRYVLLDFWSTSCTPCIAEMPNLKAMFDTYGNTGRLMIISLSTDEKPQDALTFVRKHQLPWLQAWIRNDPGKLVVENYTPQIWLIGPDGVIIANDLQGDRIKLAIETAVSKGGFSH